MTQKPSEESFRPLTAVVDSCVFPTSWIKRIVERAALGHVRPIWSPCIVAESNRVLTWIWLKNNPGFSTEAERRLSQAAKRMFSYLTRVFSVEEDRPPYETAWAEPVRDSWDLPIWSAAIRSHAQFVVTFDMKDAPPEGEDGVREYEGVIFVHPRVFLGVVDEALDSGRTHRALRSMVADLQQRGS